MFTSPAEVWSASFAHDGDRNMVLSCGDEGCVKVWDIRSTTRPMQILKTFNAGATCASHHPRHEHLVACGSYDETICLYDVRYFSSRPIAQSQPLGGGIWRLKWHPYRDYRLLVGAMHGGCRVVRINRWSTIDNDEERDVSMKVTKRFTEHERYDTELSSRHCRHTFLTNIPFDCSMVYGADWLVCRHPTQNGYFEAAASCSFYDRNVFLWDTVF
jgi:diphthine methyl ester acylhydrolase